MPLIAEYALLFGVSSVWHFYYVRWQRIKVIYTVLAAPLGTHRHMMQYADSGMEEL